MEDQHIKHYTDIGFTVVASPESYWCDFKVYEIFFVGEKQKPEWHKREGPRTVPTANLYAASVYLRGSVKWDGCSDWHFDEQDEVMLHFCGRDQMNAISTLLTRMFDQASELIPKWSSEVAE